MATKKDTALYIGEDIYSNLPEEEQEKFDLFESYKPDYLGENIQYMQDNDPSGDWYDECFKDLEDYENFMGMDWDSCGGRVYKRSYDLFTGEDEKYFMDLAEKEDGNQMRVKYE